MPAPSQHRRGEHLAAGTDPRFCPYPGPLLRWRQTQHQVADTAAAHSGQEPELRPQRTDPGPNAGVGTTPASNSTTGAHIALNATAPRDVSMWVAVMVKAASPGPLSQPADRSDQQGSRSGSCFRVALLILYAQRGTEPQARSLSAGWVDVYAGEIRLNVQRPCSGCSQVSSYSSPVSSASLRAASNAATFSA